MTARLSDCYELTLHFRAACDDMRRRERREYTRIVTKEVYCAVLSRLRRLNADWASGAIADADFRNAYCKLSLAIFRARMIDETSADVHVRARAERLVSTVAEEKVNSEWMMKAARDIHPAIAGGDDRGVVRRHILERLHHSLA